MGRVLNPYTLKFQEMIHVLPGRATILGQDPQRDVEIEEFKRRNPLVRVIVIEYSE